MKKINLTLAIFLCVLLYGQTSTFGRDISGKERTITFFHTNDMHGTIINMGKIMNVVERERKSNKNVFLVNAGDNFSGNPIVDQYNPKGEPMLILMNRLKFNVEALGNHDFDYGQKILKSFIFRAKFPILCANIKVLPKNDFPRPYPYYLVENEDGTEIVFLGVIQIEENTGIPSTLPQRVRDLKFSDGIETVKKYMWLKRENNILVVVSHLGIGDDIKLAEQTRGIDLIIGGHSHTVIENPKEVNGTLIVQAGSYLKYLGRVDLTLIDGKIVSKKGRLINLSKVHSSNEEIDKLVRKFNDNPVLDRVLTKLKYPVSGRRELGLMVTDALRKRLGLDVIFYNEGGIRKNKLAEEVTIKDIYSMHPFGNYIVKIKMDTSEIKDLIKNDYISHKGIDIIPSGLTYRVVRDLNYKVIDIELFFPDGKKIEDNRNFSVGMNNYIFSSYKFHHKNPAVSLNIKTVDIMLDYFKNLKETIDYRNIVRARDLAIFRGKLEKLGTAGVSIYTKDDKFASNSVSGNLIADAIKDYSGADISIFPTRLLKKGVIVEAKKPIFTEMLPNIYHHIKTNKIVTAEISGKVLREFLFKRFHYKNNIDVHLSGIKCALILSGDNTLKNIKISFKNGNSLNNNIFYKVAFVDYEFNKFYRFAGKVLHKTIFPDSTLKILKDYIRKISVIGGTINEERVYFIR